ncbi:MAG: 50S ribosomal protein L10 [Treponemataceae bacterium]|nr:50S ribosomal protein L10 [Treponemataceae bacterium]
MAVKAKKLQPAKVEAISAVKSTLEGYNDYIFTEYRGLTVEQISNLRKQLKAKNCEYKVIKNNFARVAFEEMKVENVTDFLAGPTAIALLKEDPNEVAKVLFDFTKEVPALSVKGALIDNELYDAAKIEAFSKLPGKKQLIAMLMSAINGPVQKLAATLQAYVDKKLAEGGEAPAAAE